MTVPRWRVAMREEENGRCYLGFNYLLKKWLHKTGRLIDSGKPDILYYVSEYGPIHLERYGQRLTVVQAVTFTTWEIARRNLIPRPYTERFFGECEMADIVIAHYKPHLASLIELGVAPEKIRTVRMAPIVPLPDRTKPAPERPRVVGFAGQWMEQKRPLLAEAAASRAGAVFHLAVTVSRERIVEWIDGLGVLAFPSYADSAGAIALESLARGVPVVACELSGCSEEVAMSGAGIVVSKDRDEFCAAIKEVLDNPGYAERAWNMKPYTTDEWIIDLVTKCEREL